MSRKPITSKVSYEQVKSVDETTHHSIIEKESDDHLELFGYCHSQIKSNLFLILVPLTLGFILLIAKWRPVWKVWITCTACNLEVADTLIIKDYHGDVFVERVIVQQVNVQLPSEMVYFPSVRYGNNNFNYQTCVPQAYCYFLHKCAKYVWDNHLKTFKRLRGYDKETPCSDFFKKIHGLSSTEREERIQLYGPNKIDVEVKTYCRLLFEEVLNPFYFFQIASIILWIVDQYIYYASCIFVICASSIIISLYQTRKQRLALRDMVTQSISTTVTVSRQEGEFQDIPSTNLVPGDLLVIPSYGCVMSCDAVLIAGNCIVNESILTGESVPEVKTPLLGIEEVYNPQSHKKHTLFCGTKVIQARYYEHNKVFAVVVRTGFSTAKGELVRSILFSHSIEFKFYQDAIKFVVILFCISALGMAYSLYCYVRMNASLQETIIRALDLVTIVVPPALPAALTIGTVCAQSRLKKQKIYCTSPASINVGGKLNVACFDKTGTLTEDGLELWGVIPSFNGCFHSVERNPSEIEDKEPLKAAMACCHSLTVINGEIIGDPLDLRMFTSVKWTLEEPGADVNKYDIMMPTVVRPPFKLSKSSSMNQCTSISLHDSSDQIQFEIGIIRIFPFSSSLQRMSVICRTLGAKCMNLYVKGAPEQIVSLCLPDSVPSNFYEVLHNYTIHGFRVIALAWRSLNKKLSWHHAQRIKREEVEHDLSFLGLLIMQNKLKPKSTPVIKVLQKALIRTVMITGDNLLTAMSVARDCNMICKTDKIIIVRAFPPDKQTPARLLWENAEILHKHLLSRSVSAVSTSDDHVEVVISKDENFFHFAIDGNSYGVIRMYFPHILPKLLVRGTVFARMAPEQKTQIVEGLQELQYVVSMCGDGANDCGALKAADVGISLSEAEASVAANFTSHITNIECVPAIIREGRCSLVTSFSIFKFIALYSLIQFTSVLVLYTVKTNFTDAMFLYVDLGVITSLAVFMSYTGAHDKLVIQQPESDLISIISISSLLLQTFLVIAVEITSILYLQAQSWYHLVKPSGYAEPSWENTTIFLLSSFQYIIMVVVFSKGPPYRKPLYTNVLFLGTLVILSVLTTVLLFSPFKSLAKFFQILPWDVKEHFYFRLGLFLLVCCNSILSSVIERLVIHIVKLKHLLTKTSLMKPKYKEIEEEIKSMPCWPCLEESLYTDGHVEILT